MKQFLTFCFILISYYAFSVPNHWSFEETEVYMKIKLYAESVGLQDNTVINNDLNTEYLIGAFIIRDQKETCIGYMTLDADKNSEFKAYGQDSEENQVIYIRLWDVQNECEISTITSFETKNNDEIIFRDDEKLSFDELTFVKSTIEIAYDSIFCQTETIQPLDTFNNITFSTTHNDISIDSLTGIVSIINALDSIQPTLFFTSNIHCLSSKSQNITIYSSPKNTTTHTTSCDFPLKISSSEISTDLTYHWSNFQDTTATITVNNIGTYIVSKSKYHCVGYDTILVDELTLNNHAIELTQASCEEQGSIMVDNDEVIENYHDDLHFSIDDHFFFSDFLDDLSEGEHNLMITTQNQCKLHYAFHIKNTCLSTHQNIIAPNMMNYTAFPIEDSGAIQIYNRSGILINTLEGPTEWNGTNQNGEMSPIGLYFIVKEDGNRVPVTILD